MSGGRARQTGAAAAAKYGGRRGDSLLSLPVLTTGSLGLAGGGAAGGGAGRVAVLMGNPDQKAADWMQARHAAMKCRLGRDPLSSDFLHCPRREGTLSF